MAFFTIEPKLAAFFVGVGFSTITFLVERNLFYFKTEVLFPIPEYDPNSSKTRGLFFTLMPTPELPTGLIPCVGITFSSESEALDLYQWLLRITGGRTRDISDYLSLSVVILSEKSYIFYVLPNLDNPDVQKFYADIEAQKVKEAKRRHEPIDVHMKHVRISQFGTTVLDARLETRIFFERYKPIYPVIVKILLRNGEGVLEIPGLDTLTLSTMKVRRREELTQADVEYSLIQLYGTYEEETRQILQPIT
jgi:hypothetical protein